MDAPDEELLNFFCSLSPVSGAVTPVQQEDSATPVRQDLNDENYIELMNSIQAIGSATFMRRFYFYMHTNQGQQEFCALKQLINQQK